MLRVARDRPRQERFGALRPSSALVVGGGPVERPFRVAEALVDGDPQLLVGFFLLLGLHVDPAQDCSGVTGTRDSSQSPVAAERSASSYFFSLILITARLLIWPRVVVAGCGVGAAATPGFGRPSGGVAGT